MNLTFQNETLNYPKVLPDLAWQVSLESQLNLPEGYPEPQTVLESDFQIGVPQLTIVDDLLLVSGKIIPSLIYRGPKTSSPDYSEYVAANENDQANLESYGESPTLPVYIPEEYGYIWPAELGIIYQEQIAIPGLTPDMLVDVDILPLAASLERSGPGLLEFSGRLELLVHVAQPQQNPVISEVALQASEGIKLLKETIQLEVIAPTKRALLPFESFLTLPPIKPRISRVLKHFVRPVGLNSELLPGKVVVKGFLEMSLVYVGCDDTGQPSGIFVNEWLHDQGAAVPFETTIEANTDKIQATPRAIIYQSTVTLQSASELRCQAQIDCQVRLSSPYQQELVTDVIPGPEAIIDQQKYLMEFEEYFGSVEDGLEIDQTLELPFGLPGIDRILAHQGRLSEFKVEAAEGKIFIEGNLNLELFYTKADFAEPEMVVANWKSQIPVNGVIQFPNLQPAALLQTQLMLDAVKLEIAGEHKLRVTGKVAANSSARLPRAIFVMRDCAVVEPIDPESRPSMLFYIVQPGDTLWKIARRYQSTVATLEKANSIANPDQLASGQKILIPKQTLAI